MTKTEAISRMIAEVERVEKERLAAHFSIDATHHKNAAIVAIIKALKEIKIDDEDQQD